MNQNYHAPAFPLVPFQDKFGQMIITPGLSKIELITVIIAGQLAAKHSEQYLPETIAEEAFAVALSTLEKLDEEIKKSILNDQLNGKNQVS